MRTLICTKCGEHESVPNITYWRFSDHPHLRFCCELCLDALCVIYRVVKHQYGAPDQRQEHLPEVFASHEEATVFCEELATLPQFAEDDFEIVPEWRGFAR